MDEDRLARLEAEPMGRAGRPTGLFRGTAHSITDIWTYRGLLNLLVRRELKARYKDSTLGFLWSLLRPLALLAVYYVAIGKFLGAAYNSKTHTGTPDYAIFIYSGITIWTFFSEMLSTSTGSIIANAGLVKKIYLPREVFPLAAVGAAAFNFCIQILILLCGTLIAGKPPTGIHFLYAVLAVTLITIVGVALAFLLSALNVYLRDVQYLVEISLMFLMWTAPVVYQYSYVANTAHGTLLDIYQISPLTLGVEAFQRAFWVDGASQPSQPPHLAASIVVEIVIGIFFLWGCQRVFARLQDNFAQEI